MTAPLLAAHPALAPPPPPVAGKPPPRARRRWPYVVGAAVTAALLAGGGLLWFELAHPAAPAYRTTRVVRADITQLVTATGTLQPVLTSPVGAQASGIVWKLHADFNSEVKAGEVLVELDPALFENAVAQAVAQLAQAQANLTSAQATALGARNVRDRTRELERTSLVAGADLDAAQAIFGQTTGLARSTLAQIAQATAQLQRARLDLAHSVIHSPVDGTVISRNIDVGQAVAATLTAPTLFTIAQDLRQMQVHAAVDEADIGQIAAGQAATFTVDAFREQTFQATVNQVRNAPQTAQNVVTYDVVLDVENPRLQLRPGMTANVQVLIVHQVQVVAVPNEALRFRPVASVAATTRSPRPDAAAGTGVYVSSAEGLARVPVKLGVTDGTLTEVLAGLEPGREVVIDVLRDGSKPAAGAGAARGP